jgi:hypothetical protein
MNSVNEILNYNPGLVPNDSDGKSCFLACSQMILRTKPGTRVLSFEELGAVIHRRSGEYSWEYAMLTFFSQNGFEVKFISKFDLRRLCDEGNKYMYEFFGTEAAEDQIRNSNMTQALDDARLFLQSSGVQTLCKVPQLADIKQMLNDGFYLIPYVNQRIFQADEGYVAHTILIYGCSSRGVRMHNPGPPATEASEISWKLFEKAWSSPNVDARILFAVRPI